MLSRSVLLTSSLSGYAHATISTLEFGGLGSSGQGSYRGKASFECFTHRRAIAQTPGWMESLLSIRYPPYAGKISKYRSMTALKPDFDRQGRQKLLPLKWLATVVKLGADNGSNILTRYFVVLLRKLTESSGGFRMLLTTWCSGRGLTTVSVLPNKDVMRSQHTVRPTLRILMFCLSQYIQYMAKDNRGVNGRSVGSTARVLDMHCWGS